MAKQTVEARKAQNLCISCGGPNDKLPLLECSACTEKRSKRGRAYYRHNRAKVLKRTRSYYLEHQEEYKTLRNDWFSKNPSKVQLYRQKIKLKALQIVSTSELPTCVYCGCDDIRFLEINHKEGGGAKETLMSGSNFYWAIVKGERPTNDLEVTCGPHNRWHFYKLKYGEAADRFQIVWK